MDKVCRVPLNNLSNVLLGAEYVILIDIDSKPVIFQGQCWASALKF